MVKDNLIQDRSYRFALRIVDFCLNDLQQRREYVLSKQLLRSGTSIGANVEEAIGAHSTKDFLNKIVIAYKEARETHYWLRLIRDSRLASEQHIKPLIDEVHEMVRIIAAIIKTTKSRNNLD
jgi:four helix bundle protein